MTLENWLGIAGGIALFLFGIRTMGNGIELLAGSRLKSILEKLTQNRFMGLFVGLLITGIIQSSNATTVMTVGFVNAGLMPLENAVGVIMGANIGTTVTGQLIAFKVDSIAPIIALIGVTGMTFIKKKPWSNIFYAATGLGLLFMGMLLMKDNMTALGTELWFQKLILSLENPILGVLFGAFMTMLLQSVSASVGVLQAMAGAGIVGLDQAIFVICGQNIGCTMVSVIAAVGGTKDAKRAAAIHVMFNLFACIICVALVSAFPAIIGFIKSLSPGNGRQQLANANTLLKISATLIMFPLSKLLIKLSRLIIRGSDSMEGKRLLHIGGTEFGSAAVAVSAVEQEAGRMFDIALCNIKLVREALAHARKGDMDTIHANEETLDYLNREISRALVEINRNGMGEADARSIDRMHHTIVDFERIGDHAENIAGYIEHMRDNRLSFSDAAMDEIMNISAKVCSIVEDAYSCMKTPSSAALCDIERREQEIDDIVQVCENAHIKRLEERLCSADVGMLYVEMLTDLERVSDHALNIAQAGTMAAQ